MRKIIIIFFISLIRIFFRTFELLTKGFFVYWEQKVFNKYRGLLDKINSFENDKYIRDHNKFRNGLELKNFDSFFYLLISGLCFAFVLNIFEYSAKFEIYKKLNLRTQFSDVLNLRKR